MKLDPVTSASAPAAIGPYSQAIRYGDLLFCSGVIPIDESGEVISEAPADQVEHCLRSLTALAEAAETSLALALRVTIYTTMLDRFAEINDAYAKWFETDPPARVTIGAAALPRGVAVEVEATIAVSG